MDVNNPDPRKEAPMIPHPYPREQEQEKQDVIADYLTSCGDDVSGHKEEGKEYMEEPVYDAVNPSHYRSHPSGVECIDITEHYGFNIGNTIKYLWRAGLKGDAIEDLRKALWYLEREIAKREAEECDDYVTRKAAETEKADADPLKGIGYLCNECAEELGGVWPEGHIATFHTGTCDCCHTEQSLSNTGDWNWPDGERRGMRD
jgi:hypothetical protein